MQVSSEIMSHLPTSICAALGGKRLEDLKTVFKDYLVDDTDYIDMTKILDSKITDFRIQMVLMKSFDFCSNGFIRYPMLQESFGKDTELFDRVLGIIQRDHGVSALEAFGSAYIDHGDYVTVAIARLPFNEENPERLIIGFFNYSKIELCQLAFPKSSS